MISFSACSWNNHLEHLGRSSVCFVGVFNEGHSSSAVIELSNDGKCVFGDTSLTLVPGACPFRSDVEQGFAIV